MKKPERNAKAIPKPAKHRPTAGELEQRINTVYGLIVSGTRRAEILQFGAVQWGIEQRQVDDYIASANALIKAEGAKEREQAFAEEIALRNQIIKQALADKDYNAANTAARDRAKLRDLYPADKQELHATTEQTVTHIYLPDNGRDTYPATTSGSAGEISSE